MTELLQGPKRNNEILPVRLPALPLRSRSRAARGLTAAAALGRFELQVCRDCSSVQYPPREACHRCLSVRLDWKPQSGEGELISETTLHHSHDPYYRQRLPWRLGMVRLDSGPIVITHVHHRVGPAPRRVLVGARLDKAGEAALVAFPISDGKTHEMMNMTDDSQLREMTCDPKSRKVLVTDGGTAFGQAMVRDLVAAGAERVWVGCAERLKNTRELEELSRLEQVSVVPLDVTDSNSVREAGAALGVEVDILINNAELHRTCGASAHDGIEGACAEMDVNYFGLLRLAQEFAPVMRSRAAGGDANATAWVNVLSVYALSNFPAHGTFSASKAAAHSLAQYLRAEMQPAGIRVINVFPGPLDDGSNQELPPPKLNPAALARAIVQALQDGVEDVYPGDVAQEWLARWRDNPKVLERELAAEH